MTYYKNTNKINDLHVEMSLAVNTVLVCGIVAWPEAQQLRDRLKALGLPTSGRKAQLRRRLAGREHRVEAGPVLELSH